MQKMLDEFLLPFEFEDMYYGLASSKGILIGKENYLRFEFQISDNIINLLKSNVKIIDVNYLQIGSVTLQKKMFSRRIFFNFNSMKVLSQFPSSPSELVLKISKQNTKQAESLINYIILRRNEKKLEYLENS
jgi:hypothetical protein